MYDNSRPPMKYYNTNPRRPSRQEIYDDSQLPKKLVYSSKEYCQEMYDNSRPPWKYVNTESNQRNRQEMYDE